MKRIQRATAVLLAMVGSVAIGAPQAPLIFPHTARGQQPGRTVNGVAQHKIAPVGNLRIVKPLGGTKPPARTIFAKRPA